MKFKILNNIINFKKNLNFFLTKKNFNLKTQKKKKKKKKKKTSPQRHIATLR
jgi:hypothetical protein